MGTSSEDGIGRKSIYGKEGNDLVMDVMKRIQILEAIIWAQEHHNQVMYLTDISDNGNDYREQLMKQYGFDYDQAEAIIDMRIKAFTIQEKERTKAELSELMEK